MHKVQYLSSCHVTHILTLLKDCDIETKMTFIKVCGTACILKMTLEKYVGGKTVSILILVLILHCQAWLLTPSSLINQLANINNRFSIVFHLPDHENDKLIHSYSEALRYYLSNYFIVFMLEDVAQ